MVPSSKSYYLSQCWPRYLSPYDFTRPRWVKLTFPNKAKCYDDANFIVHRWWHHRIRTTRGATSCEKVGITITCYLWWHQTWCHWWHCRWSISQSVVLPMTTKLASCRLFSAMVQDDRKPANDNFESTCLYETGGVKHLNSVALRQSNSETTVKDKGKLAWTMETKWNNYCVVHLLLY